MFLKREKAKENLIHSIEMERYNLGLSRDEMAEKLGLSPGQYKKLIELKTKFVDFYICYKLYKLTGRPLSDLVFDPSTETEIVRRLYKLTDSQIAFVSSVVNFELNMQSENSTEKDFVACMVPVGDLQDGMIWDSCNFEKVDISSARLKFGDTVDCAVKITSNHLTPVYVINDILLLSFRPPRHGDTAIFINRKTGRAYIRQFLQGTPNILKPLNNFGKTYTFDPNDPNELNEWIRYAVVITKIR